MGSSCTKEQLECYTVQCQDNIITQLLPLKFDLIDKNNDIQKCVHDSVLGREGVKHDCKVFVGCLNARQPAANLIRLDHIQPRVHTKVDEGIHKPIKRSNTCCSVNLQ